MSDPQGAMTVSEVFIVEHFWERRLVANSTTVALRFGGSNRAAFAGATSTLDFSTLDSDGRLPQNKVGRLSGVMMDFEQIEGASEAVRTAQFRAIHEMRGRCRVKIYSGNTILAEHPLRVLTAPGAGETVGTTTAGLVMQGTNNGWPVAFGEHPLTERLQMAVDVDSLAVLAAAPAASSIFLHCIWQIKTATLQAGR